MGSFKTILKIHMYKMHCKNRHGKSLFRLVMQGIFHFVATAQLKKRKVGLAKNVVKQLNL